MKRFVVKLKFKTPFHIGGRRGDLIDIDEIIHSDTIFSAILSMYSLVFGLDKTNKLVHRIFEENLFKISSAFYYYKDLLFLPKPLGFNLSMKDEDYKKQKKVRFIDRELLTNYTGEITIKDMFAFRKEYEENFEIPFAITERPRVVVDRSTSAAHIYYSSSCELIDGAGLWFYLDANEEIFDEIKTVINILGDEGIGGERTYGMGLYEAEISEEKIEEKEGTSYLLISLMNPFPDEAKYVEKYNIIQRSGYIYSPYLKSTKHSTVNVFSEGSTFSKDVKGKILDFTPDGFSIHRILKDYRAFTIPY